MDIKRDTIVWVAGLTFIFIVGIASYFAFLTDEERHKRLTSEVPATVTNVYERRAVNPRSGAEGTVDITVTYKYVIEGQEYERTVRLSMLAGSAYREGQPAKVCYNPRKHEEAELFPAAYRCGT
jgi:hypothetical protein